MRAMVVDLPPPYRAAIDADIQCLAPGEPLALGRVDLVVVGPLARDPLVSAQGLSRVHRPSELVILAPVAEVGPLARRLLYTPFMPIGSRVISAPTPQMFRRELERELYRAARRTELRAALDQSRRRLAATAAARSATGPGSGSVRELERSNAELEMFAHAVAHDLQEPLRVMAGFATLLVESVEPLDSKAARYARHVADNAGRMQGQIRDLLTYARVGGERPPMVPTDLGEVVRRVLARMRLAINLAGARVWLEPLPVVRGDAGQLGRLLQNLVENALKFSSGRPPRIAIGAEQTASGWVVSVSDNGIGIDREHTTRIFDIFQRLHTRDEYPGNGIGLAIARRIVEQHGGAIWVESATGAGTTFRFSLRR